MISAIGSNEHKVKAVFELRAACLAGYMPDLSGCSRCGSVLADRFDISAGRLECAKCRVLDSDGIRMPLTSGALEAMRYICGCDAKFLFSFQQEEQVWNFLLLLYNMPKRELKERLKL